MNIRDVARPRVWFEDVPNHIRSSLAGLTGGHEGWGTSEDPFDPFDWDLVVLFGGEASRREYKRLHVLAFGADSAFVTRPDEMLGGTLSVGLYYDRSTHSRAVRVHAGEILEEAGWGSLLLRTIAEVLPEGEKQFWSSSRSLDPPAEQLVLVGEGEGEGGAAILVQRDSVEGSGELLLLPPETIDHAAWLVALLDWLRTRDPVRFPARPDWKRRAEWAPAPLLEALEARQALEAAKAAAIAEYDARLATAAGLIEQTAAAAASGAHRLLTEQGDPLEEAVSDVLSLFGYRVRNMDAEKTDGAARLEDFRLTDPSRPGWEALVEVKGYLRGAKAGDVGQLTGRPTTMYAAENGRAPSQVFLIVNGNLGADPSLRAVALDNDPAAIEVLRINDGALVDTRDLFRATRAIESGEATVEAIRESLFMARGRWTFNG